MAVAWPAGVPDCTLRPRAQVEDTRQRFEPDIGPPIVRRQTTLVQPVYTMRLSCSLVEFALFEAWFAGPLAQGANAFAFVDPIRGVAAEWLFEDAYSYSEILRGKRVDVGFEARRLRLT
jgi:hypothetical protein